MVEYFHAVGAFLCEKHNDFKKQVFIGNPHTRHYELNGTGSFI
jgi:hypothetical protein